MPIDQSLSLLSQQTGLFGPPQTSLQPTSSPLRSSWDLQVARDQVQISAYGLLLSAMSGFWSSVQALKLPGFITQNLATSSNSAVASAATSTGFPSPGFPQISGSQPATFNLSVTSLATAQSLQSAAFVDPNITVVGTGSMTITAGTYNAGPNTFTAGPVAPVTVTITDGTLNGIAAAINSSGALASATVVQDGAGYHLQLTSSATGTASSLRVLVTDNDGTHTDNADGLSRLAFDPTAAVGAGKNLTQTQAAANAAFSINGATSSSQLNTGIVLATGVTANLLSTGSTVVTVQPDYGGLQTSVQSLISAYNTVQGTLNNLTAPLAPLTGDLITSGLIRGLNNITQQSYSNGSSSLTTLVKVGVSSQFVYGPNPGALVGTGNNLALSTTSLQSAFNSDPNGAVSLLTAVVQAFDTYARSYVGGGGTVPKMLTGLQHSTYVDRYLASSFNASSVSKFPDLSELLSTNSQWKGSRPPLSAGDIQYAQQYARQTLLFSPPGGINAALLRALFGPSSSSSGSFSIFA